MAHRGNRGGRYYDHYYDDSKPPSSRRLSARGSDNPFDNSNFDRSGAPRRRAPTDHRPRARAPTDRHTRAHTYPPRPPPNDYRGPHRTDYHPRDPAYGARHQRDLPPDSANLERSFRNIHDRFDRDARHRVDRDFHDAEHSMDRAFKREATLDHDPTWGPNRKRTRHVPGGAIAKRKNVEEFLDVDMYCQLCEEPFRTPSEKLQHDNSKKHNDMLLQRRADSVAGRVDHTAPANSRGRAHASGADADAGARADAGADAATLPRNVADTAAHKEERRQRREKMLALIKEYVKRFDLQECPAAFREWVARSIDRAKEMDKASPGGNMIELVNKEIVYVWACHYREKSLRKISWSRRPFATGEELRMFNDDEAGQAPEFDKKGEEALARAEEETRKEAMAKEAAAAAAAAAATEDDQFVGSDALQTGGSGRLNGSRGRTHFISEHTASEYTDVTPSSTDGRPESATAAPPLAEPEPEIVITEPKRAFKLPESVRSVMGDNRMHDISNISKFYALRTNSAGKGVAAMSSEERNDADAAERRARLKAVMDKFDQANREIRSEDYEYDEVMQLLREAANGLVDLRTRLHLLRKCLRQQVQLAIEFGNYKDLTTPLTMLIKSFKEDGDWNMDKDGEFVFHWLISMTLLATTHKTDIVPALRATDELELAMLMRMLPKGAGKQYATHEAISVLGFVFANNWIGFFERRKNSMVHQSYGGNTRKIVDGLVGMMRERALVTMLTRNRVGGRVYGHEVGVKEVPTLRMGEVMDWLGYGKALENGPDFALNGAKQFIEKVPQDIRIFRPEDGRNASVVGTNEVGEIRHDKVNVRMLLRWAAANHGCAMDGAQHEVKKEAVMGSGC